MVDGGTSVRGGGLSVRPSVHPHEATCASGGDRSTGQAGIHLFKGGKVENDALTAGYLPPPPQKKKWSL